MLKEFRVGSPERTLKRETGLDVRELQPRPPGCVVEKWLYQARNGYEQQTRQTFCDFEDARTVSSCEFLGIERSLGAKPGERNEIECVIGVTLKDGTRGTIYDSNLNLGVDLLSLSARETEKILEGKVPRAINEGLRAGTIVINQTHEGTLLERR